MRPWLLLFATLCHLTAANVVLVHGDTELTVALPDPTGLGTRYDPTSMAPSARWRGHSLFASFTHPNYPETNTTAGFAEEYDTGESSLPPGWKEAALGEAFLKIPVGALRKEAAEYLHWRTQPVAARGTWTSTHGPDWCETRWDSPLVAGIACTLTRRIEVHNDGFRIQRRLINRGLHPLSTEHYAHHFLCFDEQPLAPGYEIDLGYTPSPVPPVIPIPLHLAGRVITIGTVPDDWTPTSAAALVLPGPIPAQAESARCLTIRHRGRNLEMRVLHDHTPTRTTIYSTLTTLSPESFVTLSVPVAGETAWSTQYLLSAITP